jgi:anti-anti-sigma regulatory factor
METNVLDQGLVFSFSERLDTVGAMALQKEIVDTIAAHDDSFAVTFDFAGVNYIASGFIRIIMLVVRMKKNNFSIVNIDPEVRKTLMLVNLNQLIKLD